MSSIFRSAIFFNMLKRIIPSLVLIALASCNAEAVIIDKIAVIVNNDVVTFSEIRAIEQLQLDVSGLPPEKDAIQRRINHHLVLQQIAKQPPLSIPEEKIQEVIDKFVQQHEGGEEFLLFLHSIGMNYQDFDSELREQLSIEAFVSLRFRPFASVTIEEAERYYYEVFRAEYEVNGQQPPAFALSFDEIQARLVEEQVRQRTREWLDEVRKTAVINVKE